MYKNSAHCSIGEIISNFPADASSSSGVKDACTHTRDCKTCNQEATQYAVRSFRTYEKIRDSSQVTNFMVTMIKKRVMTSIKLARNEIQLAVRLG